MSDYENTKYEEKVYYPVNGLLSIFTSIQTIIDNQKTIIELLEKEE